MLDKPENHHDTVRAIMWREGRLVLLDQRRLPAECEYLSFDTPEAVAGAIRTMVVRGAPAIVFAAALGMCDRTSKSLSHPRSRGE